MTLVRRNVWSLGTEDDPWDPVLLGYATAVAAMQDLPITDSRSWRYQGAIHGNVDTNPPAQAPWNECQHQSWFFLPWHRMYLFHFEKIVASFLPADVRDDWALPYWDYSHPEADDPSHALPPAFRAPHLPNGDDNPLFVPDRRPSVNNGDPLPAEVYDIAVANAEPGFTGDADGGSAGFGGPQTGFFHGGPDGTFGVLETTPHGSVHVWVGGRFGLMFNPDTAAIDPIFWLHHANIDRLWATWDLDNTRHPTATAWLNQRFRLRDVTGALKTMTPRGVRDIVADLDYTYESLPAQLDVEDSAPVPRRPAGEPFRIGANEASVVLDRTGASTDVVVGEMPPLRAAAEAGEEPRVYLTLADIRGDRNPGVVYGVYVNLPADSGPEVRSEHLAGVVSFFGIELTSPAARGGRDAQGMRYSFEITALVDRLRARADWDPARLTVTLVPLPGSDEESDEAPAREPVVQIGTVGLDQVSPG